VQVQGQGRGGRNLEFVLSIVETVSAMPHVTVASIGTDGIDGATDVAGAWADADTAGRARERGLAPPAAFLQHNDSFNFFAPLGDTIRTGRTETNVGDMQVFLIHP
jgi:hydroxypyruvate reductase